MDVARCSERVNSGRWSQPRCARTSATSSNGLSVCYIICSKIIENSEVTVSFGLVETSFNCLVQAGCGLSFGASRCPQMPIALIGRRARPAIAVGPKQTRVSNSRFLPVCARNVQAACVSPPLNPARSWSAVLPHPDAAEHLTFDRIGMHPIPASRSGMPLTCGAALLGS